MKYQNGMVEKWDPVSEPLDPRLQDHRDAPARPGPPWPSETPKTLSNLRDTYWDRQNDLACREAPWDHRYSSGFDA